MPRTIRITSAIFVGLLPLVAQMLFCVCDPSQALASVILRSQPAVLAPSIAPASVHAVNTPAPRASAESAQASASKESNARVEAGHACSPEPIDDWLTDICVTEYPLLHHIIPALSLRSLVAHEADDSFPSPPSLVTLSCQLTT